MPAALPGYDFASSWLAESLTAVPYQPDCGSSGGCDSLDVNLVHQGAHLLGVGARGIPSAPKAAPRSFALSAELQRDLLRNGVPHNRLGSSHVVRERRHLLLGAQDAAQHTQELTNLGLLEIPRYVFKTARSLIKLDLTNNQLGSLPAEIQHLTALETLLVPRNGLKTLPDAAISGMRALTELDCSKNELAGSLFEHVFAKALSKLQRLDASSNKLSAVCGSVAELSSLHTLDVAGNDIKTLPNDVLLGPALKLLDARRNPLIALPANAGAAVLQHSMPVAVALEGYGKSLLLGGADCAANVKSMRACRVSHVLAIDEQARDVDGKPFDAEAEWWGEMFDATVEPIHPLQPNSLMAALPRCLTWMRAALAHGRRHGMTLPMVDPPAPFFNAPMQPSAHCGVSGVDHSKTLSTSYTTTHDDTLAVANLLIFSPTDTTKAVAVAVAFVMAVEGKTMDQAISSVLGAGGVCEVTEQNFRTTHWAHELKQLEEALNCDQQTGEPQYCWQNHLKSQRVQPALHPTPDSGVNTGVPTHDSELPPTHGAVTTEYRRDWSCGGGLGGADSCTEQDTHRDWNGCTKPSTVNSPVHRDWEPESAHLSWDYPQVLPQQEPRDALSTVPLHAASRVVHLMRHEVLCDDAFKNTEKQVALAEKEMLESDFPAEAHERLMELRDDKAKTMAQMDEDFANLAVITEDLGCHVFTGGTIHSHLH